MTIKEYWTDPTEHCRTCKGQGCDDCDGSGCKSIRITKPLKAPPAPS